MSNLQNEPVVGEKQVANAQSPNLKDEALDEHAETPEGPATFKHSWTLWCIFSVLCLLSFLTALDGTIITTSLPTITSAIGGQEDGLYVWIAQCFIFASTAPQPLYGQIADIFGRRNPFLAAIALFALGSGIAGGAKSPTMLISGRTVQGLGAAGLYVLSDILICDLVPPRHRGPYLSAVLSTAGIGSTAGPVIGGAMARDNWRWIFYLNIPISVIGFLTMIFLLKVNYVRSPTWKHALARVDYIGAVIFIPSTIAVFYALITGGINEPWSSWRIILPLVLGICGWILYFLQQKTPSICPSPSTPIRLFANRTSVTGYALVFLSSVALYTISFFLPIYFQAVKLTSALLSGVYYLPFSLAIIPFAGGSGWLLSKWGKYIPLHYTGTALLAIGTGLFAMLDASSSRGAWIGLQIIPAAGIAIIYTVTMPSTLSALPEADVAVATATYSFVRSFGFVWGITMGGIVFNSQVNAHLDLVRDKDLRNSLRDGAAYAFAGSAHDLKDRVDLSEATQVYVRSLRVVWFVLMAIGLLSFVLVPLERSIELRKEHETEFGIRDDKDRKDKVAPADFRP